MARFFKRKLLQPTSTTTTTSTSTATTMHRRRKLLALCEFQITSLGSILADAVSNTEVTIRYRQCWTQYGYDDLNWFKAP